jgi:hypothetical protein
MSLFVGIGKRMPRKKRTRIGGRREKNWRRNKRKQSMGTVG